VRVRYPLAGQNIDFQVKMERRNGHWYPAQTLNEVDELLANWQAATTEPPENPMADESSIIQTAKEDALIDLISDIDFFE